MLQNKLKCDGAGGNDNHVSVYSIGAYLINSINTTYVTTRELMSIHIPAL